MGNVAHIEEEMKNIVKDVHSLDLLAVRLISIFENGVTVLNGQNLLS